MPNKIQKEAKPNPINRKLRLETEALLPKLTELRKKFIAEKGYEHPVTVRIRYAWGWLQGAAELMDGNKTSNPETIKRNYNKK